VAIIFCYRF